MPKKIAPNNSQLGQTLIETLVAIFILITGLSAAISLAISTSRSTDNSSKKIVATGLAREGIEVVKNIRDSNWLNDNLSSCPSMGTGQQCYQNWQGNGNRQIKNGNFSIRYLPSSKWVLNNGSNYQLLYDTDASGDTPYSTSSGVNTIYYRRIDISVSGYTADVTSTVWWVDRGCPRTNTLTSVPAKCKVALEMHLTNWKNY